MKIEPRTFTLPSGEVLTVRSLCADDAEALNAFRYTTYSETYFMARYPEEGANLEAMGNRLADCGKALRTLRWALLPEKSWWGVWGCTGAAAYQIPPSCRNGHLCPERVLGLRSGQLSDAAGHRPDPGQRLRAVGAGVYSDNARAIHLYEKFGFERYGIQPRAFKLKDGTYRDEIIMVKML